MKDIFGFTELSLRYGRRNCLKWLGILNTFRTFYYEEIISFRHKIEELNLEFAS